MPVCPECSFWTPEFGLGDVDHNGTWYCNGCWGAWEEERREQRISSGKLLPEDRVVWYSNTTSPVTLDELTEEDALKMSLYEQFRADSSWLKVDTYSLVIEVCCEPNLIGQQVELRHRPPDSTSSSSPSSSSSFGVPCVPLTCCTYLDSEFIFDFDTPMIYLDSSLISANVALSTNFVYFPKALMSEKFLEYRLRARESRRKKLLEKEELSRKEKEEREQKRKQLVEIQQKQKDLLQLAIKRAQNKKVATTAAAASVAPKTTTSSVNVWSSFGAAAVQPNPIHSPMQMPAMPVQWSLARPMIPPAIPISPWAVNGLVRPTFPAIAMIPPPVMRPIDPWSSAFVDPPPQTVKKQRSELFVKESAAPPPVELTEAEKQRARMTRFGVPFK